MVPYTKRIVNVDSSIFVAVPVELSSQRGEFLSIWNISCARNIIATTYKAVFRFHYTAILKKARRERNALNISLHALLNSTVKVDSSGFWVHSTQATYLIDSHFRSYHRRNMIPLCIFRVVKANGVLLSIVNIQLTQA